MSLKGFCFDFEVLLKVKQNEAHEESLDALKYTFQLWETGMSDVEIDDGVKQRKIIFQLIDIF